jgi:hypothetical protein
MLVMLTPVPLQYTNLKGEVEQGGEWLTGGNNSPLDKALDDEA